jgi:glycosyltransferase involved in cell wall biosynthesis
MTSSSIAGTPEPAPASEGALQLGRAQVTVVVPAFNEREGVGRTLEQVRGAMAGATQPSEIIVVDDGSTDGTGEQAAATGARVIRLPVNSGYGAALKEGIAASDAELIVIIDADGTYPAEAIPRLLARATEADMVVGARVLGDRSIPLERRPAKWFLTRLASYLAGRRIPDLNSGLRVLRRSALERFLPILPAGFSFTTTITLALLCTNHRVAYEPIAYRTRVGTSKIRAFDFGSFVLLVLRTVVLFNPLKIFLPLGAFLFAVGLAKFVYDLFLWNLSETAVMAILAAILVWSVGLLADMIARLQLRPPGVP